MLYLFTGDDARKKLLSYEKFMQTIPAGTEVFSMNRNDFDPLSLQSFYSGGGLFFSRCVVVLSYILEREDTREIVLPKLSHMSQSDNSFVFLEGKLPKAALDAFKKVKAEVNIFDIPKEKKERFNSFLLANAFGQKDKLNLWIYYREAVDREVSLEELVGVLFWKMKDLVLKNNFQKFSEAELKNSLSRLSYLLPEARSQGPDAEVAFEQFLLEVFN